MICTFDAMGEGMILTDRPLPTKFQASAVGLTIADDISFDEWRAIAESFGRALDAAAWCIGDWLVYGERVWGRQLLLDGEVGEPGASKRIPSHVYDEALAATKLDRHTLQTYASVCRAIPEPDRRERLTFAHHRLLAPLAPEKRREWLEILDSESNSRPTVKRLALSLRIADDRPRIVSDSEIVQRGEHAGHENYIPHLTRLETVLKKTLPGMDELQRRALKADAARLVAMLTAL